MLEGLDDVDWGSLSHAYGEAANVPDLIRGLASDDRDERENALDGLCWTIYHQGTIYDATAPAVPFLLELANRPDVQGRDRILGLLADIAGGCGYAQAHQVFETPARRQSVEFRHILGEERACRRAVRDAVWRGWPVFLDLLRDADEEIRQRTLQVVERLLQQPRPDLGRALGGLVACLEEPDHPAKAGILLRLGEAARFHADPPEALRAAEDHRERDIFLSNMSDLREVGEPDGLPAWLELSEEDRHRGLEAVASLWKGWPVFCRLAGSDDPAVREGAVFLQAILLRFAATAAPAGLVAREQPALVSAWLGRLEGEPAEREEADLLFALALVAPEEPRVWEALRQAVRAGGDLVGYVAALKLVDLTGDVDDRGLDRLLEVHRDSREMYERLLAMPRWGPYWVMPRLGHLGPAVVERRLQAFAEVARSAGKGIGSSGRVRELIRLAFGGRKLPAGATVFDLTEAQRQLLLAAADNGHFWTNLMNNRLQLDRLVGVPDDRRALRRFLARPGEPASDPRNDPEEALVQFERLVAFQLPFERGVGPYRREEGDTRAPFRQIQEGVEEARRMSAGYRPKDRPSIRRLEPRGHASDALVALLPLCPNLEYLSLSHGEATDASMHHLARLTRLETLDLSGTWITDEGLRHLAGLTGLRDLGLGQTEITDAGLMHLAGLVHLHVLNLCGTGVAGAGLVHLRGARELEELWLVSDHVTDEAVPHLGALDGLRKLHVGGARFTGLGLEAWEGLTALSELALRGPLAAEGLCRLPVLPALVGLDLSGPGVGDDQARALPALPALNLLTLSRTVITDAALEGIERFPSLERLNLWGTGVTDAALPHLLRLKHLRWVGVQNTPISEQAVEELRRSFPQGRFAR